MGRFTCHHSLARLPETITIAGPGILWVRAKARQDVLVLLQDSLQSQISGHWLCFNVNQEGELLFTFTINPPLILIDALP